MSRLVEHARRELELFGEDEDVIEGIVHVVQAFADCGHSGGSAPFAIAYLEKLLRFEPLRPITANPEEWEDRSDMSGYPLWQNIRDARAFSEDGGKTWWYLSEGGGSHEPTLTVNDRLWHLAQALGETKVRYGLPAMGWDGLLEKAAALQRWFDADNRAWDAAEDVRRAGAENNSVSGSDQGNGAFDPVAGPAHE